MFCAKKVKKLPDLTVPNGKCSFAANQATKDAPNLIKKMKSSTLFFDMGKNVSAETSTETSAGINF
jgi:hypothetical protein